jgi:predicted GNAT family acetyltransferase
MDLVNLMGIEQKEENLPKIKEIDVNLYTTVIVSIMNETSLLNINEIILKHSIDLSNKDIRDCIVNKIKPVLADINSSEELLTIALNIILKISLN